MWLCPLVEFRKRFLCSAEWRRTRPDFSIFSLFPVRISYEFKWKNLQNTTSIFVQVSEIYISNTSIKHNMKRYKRHTERQRARCERSSGFQSFAYHIMSFATRPGALLPFSVLRPYLVSFAPSHRISGLLFALEGSQRFGANTSCQKYYSISFLGAPWPAPVIFRPNNLTRCFAAFPFFYRLLSTLSSWAGAVQIVGIAIGVLDDANCWNFWIIHTYNI